jgi:hypothetical protein
MSTPLRSRRTEPARWGWWRDRWSRHLVAALERRLEIDACAHDGVSACPICRLVTCVGFLPAPPADGAGPDSR